MMQGTVIRATILTEKVVGEADIIPHSEGCPFLSLRNCNFQSDLHSTSQSISHRDTIKYCCAYFFYVRLCSAF